MADIVEIPRADQTPATIAQLVVLCGETEGIRAAAEHGLASIGAIFDMLTEARCADKQPTPASVSAIRNVELDAINTLERAARGLRQLYERTGQL